MGRLRTRRTKTTQRTSKPCRTLREGRCGLWSWTARLKRWPNGAYELAIFSVILVVMCGAQFQAKRLHFFDWDMLFISGLGCFVLGLWLFMQVPDKVDEAIQRLVRRGVLHLTGEEMDALISAVRAQEPRSAYIGGCLVAFAMLLAFLAANPWPYPPDQRLLTLFEVVGGFVAGRCLGRMVWYGLLGCLLRRRQVAIHVQPGHPDGAAGLKPIGDLYFFQAMVVAIPALFLALWWLIIPFWPTGPPVAHLEIADPTALPIETFSQKVWEVFQSRHLRLSRPFGLESKGTKWVLTDITHNRVYTLRRDEHKADEENANATKPLRISIYREKYARWRTPYFWLLQFVIAIEIVAFVGPLWVFHRDMRSQKRVLIEQADTLSRSISDLKAHMAQLQTTQQGKDFEALEKQLSYRTQRYWDIERMPTWPVALQTKQRFVSNILLFLMPLVSKFVEGVLKSVDIKSLLQWGVN